VERARQVLLEVRTAITDRRNELLGDLRVVVDGSRDVATDDEHDPEGATIAYERAKATALVRHAEDRLADVHRALARLEAGDYAMCEQCGRDIGEARLHARPSATTCVKCALPTA
jgi:DnaK suppressor protein